MAASKSQQALEQLLDPEIADVVWKTTPVFKVRKQSRWDRVIKRSNNARLVAGLKRLIAMPFHNHEAACELFSFCLEELPQIEALCVAENNSRDTHLFNLVRAFVVMALQGRALYPHDPVALGLRVLSSIQAGSPCGSQFQLLANLLTNPGDGTLRAGLNAVVAKNAPRLIKHEVELDMDWQEGFIAAKSKVTESYNHIVHHPQLREDWKNIKGSFCVTSYKGVHGVIWPSWSKKSAAPATLDPDTDIGHFFVAFDFFCWKWFLGGMRDDFPLVEYPFYRLTPTGTEIFIPGYWSLDAHRDVFWKEMLELHRARGVPRQGVKLADNRKQRKIQLKKLLQAEQEAQKKGWRGERRLVHLKTIVGLRQDCDDSYLHRLLHQAKEMFPSSHAQPQ